MNSADFTRIKTSDFADKSFNCSCGIVHTVKTKHIIIGEHAIVMLKDVLMQIMPAGKVLFVAEENSGAFITEIVRALYRCGYIVDRHIFPQNVKPDISCSSELLKHGEDIRLVVAFGGGEICDIVKHYGMLSGKKVVMLPSSPSGCSYLSGVSTLYVKNVKQRIVTAPAIALICDLEIMAAAPENHKAAGFGEICSFLTALIDRNFEKAISGTFNCDNIVSMVRQSLNICIDEGEGLISGNKKSIYTLTDALLRCSLCMQLLSGDLYGSEHHTADIIFPVKNDQKPLLYGEKVFLTHKYILGLYKLFFGNKYADLLLPPDKSLHSEKLSELLNCDRLYALSKMNVDISSETYRLRNYKVEEYRTEFYNAVLLAETKTNTAWVIFKRMYKDAGYWINGVIKEKELSKAVALAADLTDRYTVLSHMRNAGLFEKYLQ